MNWFRIRQYLWYRMHALGRHGIHSPMVYRLLDLGLRNRQRAVGAIYHTTSDKKYSSSPLIQQIIAHFLFQRILVSKSGDLNPEDYKSIRQDIPLLDGQMDGLFDWTNLNPDMWCDQFQKQSPELIGEQVVMVKGIHSSAPNFKAWNDLRTKKEVQLSIDLFELGLLFFSADFKERQHFVLKLPCHLRGRQTGPR